MVGNQNQHVVGYRVLTFIALAVLEGVGKWAVQTCLYGVEGCHSRFSGLSSGWR